MAEDKSIIKIPSVNNTVIVPKAKTQNIEELIYNNGIFIKRSSLGATLRKSFVLVYAIENKIYIYGPLNTRLFREVFFTLTNRPNVSVTNNSVGEYSVDFLDTEGKKFINKTTNKFEFLNYEAELGDLNLSRLDNNIRNDNYKNALYVKNFGDELATNMNGIEAPATFINKNINIYGPKTSTSSLIGNEQHNIDINFVLYLKYLLHAIKEAPDKFYYLANWFYNGIDQITSNSFSFDTKYQQISNKLGGALTENSIKPIESYRIVNSKFLNGPIQTYSKMAFFNVRSGLRDFNDFEAFAESPYAITMVDDGGGYSSLNVFDSLLGKILVIKERAGLRAVIAAFQVSKLYHLYISEDGTPSNQVRAFDYIMKPIFNNTIDISYISNGVFTTAVRSDSDRINASTKFYDIYVYNKEDYAGVHFNAGRVLELELDRNAESISDRNTGKFQVIEIE